jgi:hyperosmotically inducible periplasmic protein
MPSARRSRKQPGLDTRLKPEAVLYGGRPMRGTLDKAIKIARSVWQHPCDDVPIQEIHTRRGTMFSRLIGSAALIPALVFALSGPAAAGQRTNEADVPRGDNTPTQLFMNIRKQVLEYPHYTVFDSVRVQMNDGTVTLLGKVTMPYKKDDIEKRVSTVRGVVAVKNQITVLPASGSDDDLRVRIADALYNHPSFDRYAGLPNPPVHVIVERGRVTLEGMVDTEADRLAALSIARSFGAFKVEDQLKTPAQAQRELGKL